MKIKIIKALAMTRLQELVNLSTLGSLQRHKPWWNQNLLLLHCTTMIRLSQRLMT